MTCRLLLLAASVAAMVFSTSSAPAACLCPTEIKNCRPDLYCAGDMKHLELGWLEDAIPYVISVDTGGFLTAYEARYKKLGDRLIVIAGQCSSACTLVLASKNVCTTERGFFAFHASYEAYDHSIISRAGTDYLWSKYPENVREWIRANGGLTTKVIKVWARTFVPKCPE